MKYIFILPLIFSFNVKSFACDIVVDKNKAKIAVEKYKTDNGLQFSKEPDEVLIEKNPDSCHYIYTEVRNYLQHGKTSYVLNKEHDVVFLKRQRKLKDFDSTTCPKMDLTQTYFKTKVNGLRDMGLIPREVFDNSKDILSRYSCFYIYKEQKRSKSGELEKTNYFQFDFNGEFFEFIELDYKKNETN